MKRKPILLFIYNSFKDPLFQNILLSYIKQLQSESTAFIFHVITFEQDEFKVSEKEKAVFTNELTSQHIYWYPLEFHTGRFLLVKKFWDMCMAVWLVGKLRIKFKTKTIFAFANVAAAYSYLLSKLFNMRLMIYSYEPHSEFMAELGVWKRTSMRYRILKSLEDNAGRNAQVVLTGTKFMVEELKAKNNFGKILRAPTGVDENEFRFNAEARKQIRQRLGVEQRKVILYIGKFGDLYYKEEVIAYFNGIFKAEPNYFFIIVTRYPHEEVKNWFEKYGITKDNYWLTGNLSNQEIKDYISAGDIGISAVPPSPSQKYRSPTKVGEYLMCGLPFVTCQGVSEDDIYAEEYKVGIVVNEFSEAEGLHSVDNLNTLLEEDFKSLRDRCRYVGISYRSKSKVVETIKDQLLELT